MKTDNELIAEFMGFRKSGNVFEKWEEGYTRCLVYDSKELKAYESSLDWLHPVIVKMFDLWKPAKSGFQKSLNLRLMKFQRETPIHSHVQQIHKNVSAFLHWYKSQNIKSHDTEYHQPNQLKSKTPCK